MSLENIINQVGATNNGPRSDTTVRSISTESFQLPTGASAGYVLVSDAKGNGSWVNAGSVDTTIATGTANEILINGTTTPQTGSLVFTTPQPIAATSDVTFNSLKLSSLIPDKLVYVDSINEILSATDISEWILGTADEITVTDNMDGTITLSTPQGIAVSSSPTFADVKLTGLTASRLSATDASKNISSTSLVSWVAGTPNQVIVTDNGSGGITLSLPQSINTTSSPTFTGLTLVNPLAIASGGTGLSSLTTKAVVSTDNAGAFAFTNLTNGQLLIGSTGATPVAKTLTAGSNITITNTAGDIKIDAAGTGVSSLTGTANQVLVNGLTTPQTGACTLTLPQSIATSSTPTFTNIILSALGSSQYVKSGTGSGFTSVGSIPVSDVSGISGTAPVTYSAGTIGLSFNSTNLRNSAGALNTIQDIDQSSTPTFQGAIFTNFSASPPQVNIFDLISDTSCGYLKFYKSRSGGSVNVSDLLGEISFNGNYGGATEKKSFDILTTVTNATSGSAAATTTFSSLTGGSPIQMLTFNGGTMNFPNNSASSLMALNSSKNLIAPTIGSSLSYSSDTLNTIQDIRTTAIPTFAQLYLTTSPIVDSALKLEIDSPNTFANFASFSKAGAYGMLVGFSNNTGGYGTGGVIGMVNTDDMMFYTNIGGTPTKAMTIDVLGKVKLPLLTASSHVVLNSSSQLVGQANIGTSTQTVTNISLQINSSSSASIVTSASAAFPVLVGANQEVGFAPGNSNLAFTTGGTFGTILSTTPSISEFAVYNNGGASDNNAIEFPLPNALAVGVYMVEYYLEFSTDRAIVDIQAKTNGSGSYTTIRAQLDQYNTTSRCLPMRDYFTVTTGGNLGYFRIYANGKNASSGGYYIVAGNFRCTMLG